METKPGSQPGFLLRDFPAFLSRKLSGRFFN
jgi:hypothetical protein